MSKDFLRQISEFKERKIHIDLNPSVIYLESVRGCPYSCAMCANRHTKITRISNELLKKIEPYFHGLAVLAIHGDGEPLLGDLPYFVEQSIKHDFVLHMNSTGFLLTPEMVDILLKTKLSIRFSIHAGRPDTYKKIMGRDLESVKRNISRLVKKSKSSGKAHDFWFSFIVMKENIDEIEDFLHLAHDCGIKSVRFMRLKPVVESLKGVKMDDRVFTFNYFEQFNRKIINKFKRNLPAYRKLSKKLVINIEYWFRDRGYGWNIFLDLLNNLTRSIFNKAVFPLKRRKGICAAPFIGQLSIDQQGNVTPCCSLNCHLGNINDSTLEDIWNSKLLKQMRLSFKRGYFPKECSYCRGFDLKEYPKNSLLNL